MIEIAAVVLAALYAAFGGFCAGKVWQEFPEDRRNVLFWVFLAVFCIVGWPVAMLLGYALRRERA